MDKVKLIPGFFITVIFTMLLGGCGGNGESFSGDASLVSLTLSSGVLDQKFQSSQLEYTATVEFLTASTIVTPTAKDTHATVTVNGTPVKSGNPSEPIWLGQGDTVIDVLVTAIGGEKTKTYTITVTRQTTDEFAQHAYIKASNTDIHFVFGSRVALSGDTLAVFVRWGHEVFDGAVYIFTRKDTVWSQQAYIKASNTDAGDEFGWSVALSGGTLAVGAGRESSAATGINGDQSDNSATHAGAVYVFQ